jgi:flagellar capping protein FliD
MAATLPFDTLDYARKLQTAGVAAPQAEAQARALADAWSQAVASPDDIRSLERKMDSRFTEIDSRFTQIDPRFTQIDSRFTQIDSRFTRMESRFEAMEARMDSRFATMGASVESLRASVDTLKWVFGLVAAMNLAIFVRLVVHP